MTYEQLLAGAAISVPGQDTGATTVLAGGATLAGGDNASALTIPDGPTAWLPRALRLDGVNDYIQTNVVFNNAQFLVGGWFRLRSNPTDLDSLFSSNNPGSPFQGIDLRYNASGWEGNFVENSGAKNTSPRWTGFALNTWYFITLLRHGGVLSLAVNANSQASVVSLSAFPNTTATLRIGDNPAAPGRRPAIDVAGFFAIGGANATPNNMLSIYTGPIATDDAPRTAFKPAFYPAFQPAFANPLAQR